MIKKQIFDDIIYGCPQTIIHISPARNQVVSLTKMPELPPSLPALPLNSFKFPDRGIRRRRRLRRHLRWHWQSNQCCRLAGKGQSARAEEEDGSPLMPHRPSLVEIFWGFPAVLESACVPAIPRRHCTRFKGRVGVLVP